MNTFFRVILGAIFIAFIAHRGYYSRKHKPAEGNR